MAKKKDEKLEKMEELQSQDEIKEEVKEEKKELTIFDIPGVGAATADKLNDAGYNDLMSIAVASPAQLVDASGVTESSARKMINFCRNSMDMGFASGQDLLNKRKSAKKSRIPAKGDFKDFIGYI